MKSLALLGPRGSFSDSATDKLKVFFEKGFRKKYISRIADVFRHVRYGGQFGFLPVRNKLIGSIPKVEKGLRNYRIIKRIRMRVQFMLVAQKKIPLQKIQFIFCPRIVQKQCMKFLKKYTPRAKFLLNFDSTSGAIKKIVQLNRKMEDTSAAIGSEKAVKIYRLSILARNIQDSREDWTEFVLFKNPMSKRIVKVR